jgi:hypothetical protein
VEINSWWLSCPVFRIEQIHQPKHTLVFLQAMCFFPLKLNNIVKLVGQITLSRQNIALQSMGTFLKIHKISQKDVKLALQNCADKWQQYLVLKEFSKSSSFCDHVANMCKLCYLVIVIAFQVCMVASSLAMQQPAIFKWYPFPHNSLCVSPLNSRPCTLKFWTRDDQFLRFVTNVHTKLNLKILDCTPRSVGDLNVQPCTTLCAKRVFHT